MSAQFTCQLPTAPLPLVGDQWQCFDCGRWWFGIAKPDAMPGIGQWVSTIDGELPIVLTGDIQVIVG